MAIIRDPIDPTRILRVNADGSITAVFGAGATVTLDASSLAALENITATVSGPIALDAATLAALESVGLNTATVDAVTGTDGASPPGIAGTGIRGWLRAIYEEVAGFLTVDLAKVNGTAHSAGNPLFADVTDRIARILGTAKAQQDGTWTVALDAPTLAALELVGVQNFPANQSVNLASGPGTAAATPVFMVRVADDLCVNATGAAAAAVTVTVPAVAGQFHYIDAIEITLYSSAARTGAAAPVTVTSTNLPGTPTWLFETAGAIGTAIRYALSANCAFRSVTAGVATTIVCPAVTGGLWNVKVIYRTAT